jgi:hypothetical protein
MTGTSRPRLSEHIQQRTREWFRKAEFLNDCIAIYDDVDFEVLRQACQVLTHYRVDLAYPGPIPEEISVAEARLAIDQARQISGFVKRKATQCGYNDLQ